MTLKATLEKIEMWPPLIQRCGLSLRGFCSGSTRRQRCFRRVGSSVGSRPSSLSEESTLTVAVVLDAAGHLCFGAAVPG